MLSRQTFIVIRLISCMDKSYSQYIAFVYFGFYFQGGVMSAAHLKSKFHLFTVKKS